MFLLPRLLYYYDKSKCVINSIIATFISVKWIAKESHNTIHYCQVNRIRRNSRRENSIKVKSFHITSLHKFALLISSITPEKLLPSFSTSIRFAVARRFEVLFGHRGFHEISEPILPIQFAIRPYSVSFADEQPHV